MLTKPQKKIIQVARRHGGIYHLSRRFRIPELHEIKDALDQLYDDCDVLVNKRIAYWLHMHPAIRLNDRFMR